ncbi:hypothetical protein GZ77_12060 [Endozoicomonas montiporae]|uniref:VWFA domain-containing protein n=2 Tax=Endozoicomonas montiporae TaxID=1027273 RepID=A0A081N944_9GAMM|nr:VWA domain-containing protein [Endozoicomonas montiporae]AMO55093.1 hypothetical protein EZMO1_0875 [Endozoicomonas montiporae CL-33]KEQ14967.1 hypothetical protein GZ77_12060 [Endozoicomonas montiporae]
MNQLTLLAPQWLWLLVLVPVTCCLALYQHHKSRSDLKKLSSVLSLPPINRRFGAMLLAIALASLSLSRPAWNPRPVGIQDQGRDIVFLLDVSRSMLAEDARPNRLEVARAAIKRVVNLPSNDRFGLVAFAGEASIRSPVTRDRVFLNTLLDSIGPGSVATGGTHIGDALMMVLNNMVDAGNADDNAPEAVDIILITDGEDMGDEPVEAMALLNRLGVRLMVIGLGDSQFGARVPNRDGTGWTLDEGREHWSRLDDNHLQSLAQQAEQGIYFPIGTTWLDLSALLGQMQAMWPADSRDQGEVMKYVEGYPYLITIAIFMLLIFLMHKPALVKHSTTLSCLLLLMVNMAHADIPATVHDLEQQAAALTEQRNYTEAANTYRRMANLADDQHATVTANYNLATTLIFLATQSLDAAMGLDFIDGIEGEGEFIDPELYLSEARHVLRAILLTDPSHEASRRNLEWLAREQSGMYEDLVSTFKQDEEFIEQEQMQDAESNMQGEDTDEADEGSGDSDQEGEDSAENGRGSQGDPNFGDLDTMFRDMMESTPSASSVDIMDQARTLEGKLQQLDQQRQNAVDRDW